MSLPLSAEAADLAYRGLIELDHGSSLQGIPRYSRYSVYFVLNGDVLDTDHTALENDLVNANGVHGITTYGNFTNPFRFLSLSLDPSGPAAEELSGLTFAYGQQYGDFSRVVDVNQPPNPQAFPCDTGPCINEHITLEMRNTEVGSPLKSVWFNLYNSTFYGPTHATRQLLLDVSQPDQGFRFQDLFIHGPSTLEEFTSYRDPNFSNLRDGVLLEGPNGTVASGRFLSLHAVPAPLPLFGASLAGACTRRLRRLSHRLRRAKA
ncbi:MAG: hypothetical protein VKP70_10980 [Cyanobacteriota bacterium]|nr:hypothetical protein [Cyanobacteriota bacterium]